MMMFFSRRTLLALFVLIASIGQSNAQQFQGIFDQVVAFINGETFQNLVAQACPTVQGFLSGFGVEISCGEEAPTASPSPSVVSAPNETPVAAPVAAPTKKGMVVAAPVAAPSPTP